MSNIDHHATFVNALHSIDDGKAGAFEHKAVDIR